MKAQAVHSAGKCLERLKMYRLASGYRAPSGAIP